MRQTLLLVAERLQPQPAAAYSQEKLVFALAAGSYSPQESQEMSKMTCWERAGLGQCN